MFGVGAVCVVLCSLFCCVLHVVVCLVYVLCVVLFVLFVLLGGWWWFVVVCCRLVCHFCWFDYVSIYVYIHGVSCIGLVFIYLFYICMVAVVVYGG